MPKFFNTVNLQDMQAKNFVLEQLASDPSSPAQAEVWFNTTLNLPKVKLSDRVMVISDQYVSSVSGQGIVAVTSGLTPKVSLTSSSTAGQALLSAGTGVDPAFGALNLAGGSSVVTGILPVANGGTGAATGAANLVLGTPNGASGAPALRALVNADLPTSGVTAGSYPKVTVNAQGVVTAATTLSASDIPSHPWSLTTSTPTTLAGYGITDAVNTSLLGAASGVATLDSSGKVPTSQLPAAVIGGMNYQGTWNASTNSPTLTAGTGTKGYYYKVATAGTTAIDGNSNWTVGDLIVFNGTTWDQVQGGSSDVLSVAGRVGAVTLAVADVSGAAPLASPTLTGTPAAPTATAGTNTTQIATTAFVVTALSSYLTTTVAASTYAPLASPALTGTPTAPTASVGTHTTQIATTAFVLGQASSTTPVMNGTAAVGTGTTWARADHVHPTDTTRASLTTNTFTGKQTFCAPSTSTASLLIPNGSADPTTPVSGDVWANTGVMKWYNGTATRSFAFLDSPTFTGTPAASTAAADTATTQIATTAYVVNQGYLKSTTAASTYAPLASPALTGTPTAPTAATATNTTQIATTAFVKAQGYLTANQTITMSGDATGSGTTTIALTLASSGVTAGTYPKVTVNAKGLVTAGASLAASDIPNLDFSKITTGTVPISQGGTGATTAAAARTALGAPSKATGLIGDGSTLSYNFVHGLALTVPNACFVSVCIEATGEVIYPDIYIVDANTVQIVYGSGLAPAANAHRVTCIG